MRALLFSLLVLFSAAAFAATDVMTFRDEAQEQQFRQLTAELRCPKCQNNSIADSNSMISVDMRQKVYELMQEGKSKQEVIDYMVARYGNFVTYDPPLTPLTVLLWLIPAVAVLTGGWVIFARTRRRELKAKDDVVPQPTAVAPLNLWLLVPGVVVALVLSGWSYYQVGGYEKVRVWHLATAQTDALMDRVLDQKAKALNVEEMSRLALGLRTQLQDQPNNVDGWMMLGRIGMVLDNASTATDAWGRAYALAPTNSEVAVGYAQVLIRSPDSNDNRRGGELLRELVKTNHADVRVLSLYAFNAFEEQRYDEAISSWQLMLKLLPGGDQRRAIIERSIAQAMQQRGGS
ncbi:cytochrome c-type biogenesis protein CcmH [Trabulsiella odontotermitis]|uniref:cytochrome c-type biogenesis protein CcmH n=1 Tax=Trabulsiella odontotermitis TaxID=379893 RepID=UPI0024B67209|nr:cytochrome c-type biogenesis protein CcmH [Trabulsiella odontotermitis]WHP32684.1 cytochrome c-type biogenesis protein CcmH [Trabulsiella odontotermitis]